MSSSDSGDYEKPHLNASSPRALEFARQCFRLRIVTGISSFMADSFLANPSIKDDLIAAINDIERKAFVFTLKKEDDAHVKWAVLAEEVGFWGRDKYWEGQRGKYTDRTKYAVDRADSEMEDLRMELMEEGDIDEEWDATEAFDYGSFGRAR